MRLLLIDNFDSFTFNLVHYLEQLVESVTVCDNLHIPFDEFPSFDGIVLSPGPGLPETSGELLRGIEMALNCNKPVFGVCLGMQALAVAFGDELYNQQQVKHGIQERIVHRKNSRLFHGIAEQMEVGLYHSWGVLLKPDSVFRATAYTEGGVLMAMEYPEKGLYGVQFHPESILTPEGFRLVSNMVEIINLHEAMRS